MERAAEVWTAELSDRSFIFMNPLPNDNGVLLQVRQDQPDRSRIYLRRNNVETDIFGRTIAGEPFRTTPVGEDLVLFSFELSHGWTFFQLMSTNLCESTGCVILQLYSPPIWSPDGQKTIVRTGQQTLWLTDATGSDQTFIAIGIAPFWPDENSVGYLQTGGSEPVEDSFIEATTLTDMKTHNLLPVEALRSLLAEGMEERRIAFRSIKTSTAHPGYDWSADSEWLLRTGSGFLHLYAPAYDYQRLIVHEYPSCNFAAWINK